METKKTSVEKEAFREVARVAARRQEIETLTRPVRALPLRRGV